MRGTDLLVLALSAVIFLALSLPIAGSMTDDTYIHMQYARNLAETGQLAFNRGEPVYGATSPLWVAILALFYRSGADMSAWVSVLSSFFGLLCAAGVYYLALTLGLGKAQAAATAIMMACEAWLLRWSNVGMETSLAVLLLILCVISAAKAARSTEGAVGFGILLFLAYLARPESLLFAPLAAVSFLVSRGKRSIRTVTAWGITYAVLMAAWFALIKAHTGTYMPLTAGAKQGHAFDISSLAARLAVPLKILLASVGIPLAALVVFLVLGALRKVEWPKSIPDEARPAVLMSLLWIFALPAAYVAVDFQVLSRYMVPVSPFVIVLGVMAAGELWARLFGKWRSFAVAAVALLFVIQNVLFYFTVVVGPTRDFSQDLKTVIAGMGRWLAENSDPGAVVAAPDIGAIGYFSGRRVLDLGGLINPDINRMRAGTDVEDIIDKGLYLDLGADYLLDRSTVPHRFAGRTIKGRTFEPVVIGTVSNLGIRKKEKVTYVLYRIAREGAAKSDGR